VLFLRHRPPVPGTLREHPFSTSPPFLRSLRIFGLGRVGWGLKRSGTTSRGSRPSSVLWSGFGLAPFFVLFVPGGVFPPRLRFFLGPFSRTFLGLPFPFVCWLVAACSGRGALAASFLSLMVICGLVVSFPLSFRVPRRFVTCVDKGGSVFSLSFPPFRHSFFWVWGGVGFAGWTLFSHRFFWVGRAGFFPFSGLVPALLADFPSVFSAPLGFNTNLVGVVFPVLFEGSRSLMSRTDSYFCFFTVPAGSCCFPFFPPLFFLSPLALLVFLQGDYVQHGSRGGRRWALGLGASRVF